LKVKLATKAGFCMGVRRAMEMVLAAANKDEGPLFTYGPLIHNKQVLELLESRGIKAIEDIRGMEKGVLLIRAHGIPPQQRQTLRSSPLKIIDATCPRVAHVQALIRYHTKKGYTPVIVGDQDHAEVIGLMGYAEGNTHVINSPSDVLDLPETDRLFVVAQTTQSEQLYNEIVNAVKKRFPNALIFDTICESTRERQREVKALAEEVDGIVVVGGYHSGNSRRLAQVSESTGIPTFHIETEKDLVKEDFSSMEVIGVTAGASTPNWMIKNVIKEIEAIRGRSETLIGRWIKKGLEFLLLSNLMVALGAFSLSYATNILLGARPGFLYPLLTLLYIYAMHVLNRFLDKGASTYNDPERASFYRKYRIFLIITGIGAIIGALIISLYLEKILLLAMGGLSLLGIIYSIPIIPVNRRHLWRYSKIKDIPGSRTISEAIAWPLVITLLPLLKSFHSEWAAVIPSFFIVFSMAFVRSAFFDIFQVQGDLIVGVETLPIILGEKRTMILLKWIILSAGLVLFISPLFGLVSYFSLMLLICLLILYVSLAAYEHREIYPGLPLEYLVESTFILSGLLGVIWQMLQ
jgi:(E)-4-hydroxy-3-methyl-but-2-enyl pyrophosphate reductase